MDYSQFDHISDEDLDKIIGGSQPKTDYSQFDSISDEKLDRIIKGENTTSKPITQPTTNINNPTPQPTKTLTGGVEVNVTNPNESKSQWRNTLRQGARKTGRALLAKPVENWFLGSKEDEQFLKDYNNSNVPTYAQITADLKAGKIDQAKAVDLINKRGKLDTLSADAEYRNVRNTNIGKGAVELGTAAIGGGVGTAAAKVGVQALKQGGKQVAKQVLKNAGKVGAVGAGYGAAQGIVDENINPATEALKQAGIWAGIDLATLGAGKVIKNGANTKAGKAVGQAMSNAKNKIDEKVFDAITSTEAGTKALQALDNAKTKIGEELVKPRTFKQARAQKIAQKQVDTISPEPKTEVINESMIEEPTSPVKVETGTNTPETNLTHVDEAPVGSNVAESKMKESALAKKAKKSDEVANAIEENPTMYEAITNAETSAQAQKEIAEDMGTVHADIVKKLADEKTDATALDVEKARQVFTELQKQGRFDEATTLLELTSKEGSKLGQAVQAFSLWSKTTPEGAMLYAQKLLNKYNNGVKKDLQKRLTQSDLEEIGQAFKELNESGLTGRKLEIATAKAMKKVYKVVPKTAAQKLDGYRYINMLLSGKSRIKDFLLTAKNAFDTSVDETIAGGIDAVRSKLTKDKTRYVSANPFAGMKAWFKGFKKGANEGVEDIQNKVNTARSGETGRYGLPSDTVFEMPDFEGSLLKRALTVAKYPAGSAEKLLRYTLQIPDRAFFEARFASSLANQMKARKLTEPTQDMINSAFNEAKRAVFQENRPIVKGTMHAANFIDDNTVRLLEKGLRLPQNTLPSASKSIAPFLKTPTNVIAQGAEGLHGGVSGYAKLMNAIEQGSPEAIREAELLMGRGLRGAGELGLGVAVGKGAIDNIKHNFGADYTDNEVTGLKPNSVIIGDKAFSMQNMQTNLPFFTGIGLGEGGPSQAYSNTMDVVSELPGAKLISDTYKILSEVDNIAKSGNIKSKKAKRTFNKAGKAAKNLTASYITSLIPGSGELGEIRNYVDPVAREVSEPNIIKYFQNRINNKLPWKSKKLPAKYNKIGEEVMVNNIKNPVARAASEMIDFGVRNYNEPPEILKESEALAEKSGKSAFLIDKAPKTITVKKGKKEEKKTLNAEEYSKFQKALGKLKLENREKYVKKYKNKSDKKIEEAAKNLSKADTLAEQLLIHDMFGGDQPKAVTVGKTGIKRKSVSEIKDLTNLKKKYRNIKLQEKMQERKNKYKNK